MFLTKDEQILFVQGLAKELFVSINTPCSLKMHILLQNKEYDQIAKVEINPNDYISLDLFRRDYQAISFLKKWELLPTTYDKRQVAHNSFLEAEKQCFNFNHRHLPDLLSGRRPELYEQFCRVAKRIAYVLGECPKLEELECRFGPGASSTCRGKFSTLVHKLSNSRPESTPALKTYIEQHLSEISVTNISLYRSLVGEIVDGEVSTPVQITSSKFNHLQYVPKNGKTDRAICIEPDLNIYFQLGVGKWIRDRMLKKLNIDLTILQDRNKCLARIGSREDSIATIDLKGASDTVSKGLVEWLLPEDWYELLNLLRSKFTKYPDGTVHENEKFSSMGNGFTFELESLIFTCILREANSSYVGDDYVCHSFGDDCVINKQNAAKAVDLLHHFGFTVNTEKTYLSGLFRESCGGDFFDGTDVRPYFLKRSISDVQDLFIIANRIRAVPCISLLGCFSDINYRNVWDYIIRRIPKDIRLYGPPSGADSDFLRVGRDEASSSAAFTGCSWYVRSLHATVATIKLSKFDSVAQMGTFLYSGSSPSYRGRTGYKVIRRQFAFWELSYRPWI
jgi:hypothetical protein